MKKLELIHEGKPVELQIIEQKNDKVVFLFGGKEHSFQVLRRDQAKIILQDKNQKNYFLDVAETPDGTLITSKDLQATLKLKENRMKSKSSQSGGLISPMPGKIFKILKNEGEKVNKGETILILEAMKMEHPIKSDKDGIIKKIYFKLNDQVQGHVPLALIEEKNG